MLPEGRLKEIAMTAAVDLKIKRMKNSPERCARNLMELGQSASSIKLTPKEEKQLYHNLLDSCKHNAPDKTKDIFRNAFLCKKS